MAMTSEQAFGEVLRESRRSRRLSQAQLAEASGSHRTYISLLERGLNSPSLSMLFQLSRALSLSRSELLNRVEHRLREVVDLPLSPGRQNGDDR
jgi:transcriptional regulator with XRE-family HTH domain